MKKTVSIFAAMVLLLGAAWIGSSLWFGHQVESQYRQLLEQAASRGGAEIDIESYERGWLGATARTRIALTVPPAKDGSPSPPLTFIMINKIVNGPFPGGAAGWNPAMALIRSRVALGPELLNRVRRELPGFPEELPVTSTTVFYLGGNGESWTDAPPFRQTLGHPATGPVTFDWQGINGHSTFSAGFKECRGNLRMPSLEVIGKTGRLRLAGLEATFDLHLPQGLLGQALGDFNYSLQKLEFTVDNAPHGKDLQVALHDLAFNGSSREAEGLVNVTLRASFQRLAINGTVNGPGVYDMRINNLDYAALNELQQSSCMLGGQQSGLSQQELQVRLAAALGKIWPRIAARSPELEIRELSWDGPSGHLRCRGKVSIDGNNKAALTSLLLLPAALSAQASVDISAPLLRKAISALMRQRLVKARAASGQPPFTDQQLDALVAAQSDQMVAGLVKKNILVPNNGGTYTLTASYRPGEAILNGQSISQH